MQGPWWTKVVVLMIAIVMSVVILIPTFYPSISDTVDRSHDEETREEQWPGWFRALNNAFDHITLGLDLQGGLHLQYQVDVDKAISDRLDRFADDIREQIEEADGPSNTTVERLEGQMAIRVTTPGTNPRDFFEDDDLSLMNMNPVVEANGSLRLELDSDYAEETREYAVNQAIETIRRRIDATGTQEPAISRRGDTDIIIQLPGLAESEFESVRAIIETTAQLEFRMLHADDTTFFTGIDIPDHLNTIETVNGRPQTDDLQQLRDLFELPENAPPTDGAVRYLELEEYNPNTAQLEPVGYQPILVESETRLTGEYITDARVSTDPQTNRPYVAITFDQAGARIFGDLTRENVGEQMAIILDDIVNSAPVINEPILGGRASISMGSGGSYNETFREAERLVVVLRNGALPAPIEKQFETNVGPTLGADSVRAGALSLAVAFGLVFIFVLFYYKGTGVIANVALMLNVLFIGAVLAMLGATLTLPGIAGITLTVGMAIDANVIIYERIKEELRLGKAPRAAVEAGYAKAMSAVLDANITTGIACIVLMQYGSGPIRGFAITLLCGIFCSLYTAIIVTRLIFDYLIDGKKVTRLSI